MTHDLENGVYILVSINMGRRTMHIIYHCYGGAHSSVTAAAIHTRLLSETPSQVVKNC